MPIIESGDSNQTKYIAYFEDVLSFGSDLNYTWASSINLDVTTQGDVVNLAWTDIGADSYSIWRTPTGNLSSPDYLTSLSGTTTNYTDTSIQQGYPYRYQVRAVKGEAESIRSNFAGGFGYSESMELEEFSFSNTLTALRELNDTLSISEWYDLYQYVIYEKEWSDQFGLSDVLEKDYIIPAIELTNDYKVPEFSNHKNIGYANDLTIEANRYNSDVFTQNHYLAELLHNRGEFFTDYPDYDAHPLYSYVINVNVSLGDYEIGSLRPKIKKVMGRLSDMHPAGKTAYIYVHAKDQTGQRDTTLSHVRQELAGQDYFDDGGYFDQEEEGYAEDPDAEKDYFDEGENPIDPSLQEYYFTGYRQFDDEPRESFDQCGPMQEYYPEHYNENWREKVFDDQESFDGGDVFDKDIFVKNKSIPMPDNPENPDSVEDYSQTRFDQKISSIHMTIEQGRDV